MSSGLFLQRLLCGLLLVAVGLLTGTMVERALIGHITTEVLLTPFGQCALGLIVCPISVPFAILRRYRDLLDARRAPTLGFCVENPEGVASNSSDLAGHMV